MKKIFQITIITLTLLLNTSFAYAQSNDGLDYELVSYDTKSNNSNANTPLINLNFLSNGTYRINYQNFANAFQFFFDLLIGIAIATAVVVFMISAFQEIISGGEVRGIKQGKEGMKNAIIGLMIVLSTWLIINTVNPDLLRAPLFSGLDQLGGINNSGGSGKTSGGTLQDNP